jgi:outer membrane immunogenic protein
VEPGRLAINGAQGAVQLGFLSQGPQLVWGPEGELAFGNIADSVTDGTYTATMRASSVASLRLRAGVPVSSGLLYVTGGIALAEIDYAVSGGGVAISSSSMRAGYDIGAGYEWRIDNGWSLRGEYRYANFGRKILSDGTNSTAATPDFHALRIGINHRF